MAGVASVVLAFRDVTARLRARGRPRAGVAPRAQVARTGAERAAHHFAEMVHGLGVVVWERPPEAYRFTFVSRGAEEMLGYPVERWLDDANFWPRLIHPDDRERVLAVCEAAVRDGQARDYEYRTVAADGRVLWVREILRVVHDSSGQVRQLRGVLANITDRKRLYESEQRARERSEVEERRAQFLAQASTALASSLDLETTLQSVARLVVPFLADWCAVDVVDEHGAARRIAVAHVDREKEGLARQVRAHDLADGIDHAGLRRIVRTGRAELVPEVPLELLEQAAQDSDSLQLIRALTPRSYIGVPLVVRDQTLGAILLVRAESGHRYAADDLALAEELARRASQAVDNARLYAQVQQAVRVRDEFLAAASHELRTPLAHVKGFVSTLRQTDVQWEEATRQEFLAEIERETDRLGRLIGNLLDISRIESGGLEQLDRAPTSPGALVYGGLDRVRGLLGQRPIALEVTDDLPSVFVDGSQIERVIANLVENSTKYAPPNTPVKLTAASVEGAVELRIEDEGPGVPPEDLERIFEKFVRGSSTPASIRGTGLGLAICRSIVRAHGGRIWAENRTEAGARFVVSLPLAPSDTSTAYDGGTAYDQSLGVRPAAWYRPG